MTPLRRLFATLRSHLQGLDEAGRRELPVREPLTRRAPPPRPAPSRTTPPPQPTPTPRTPTPTPPATPVLVLRCLRLPECGDTLPPEDTALLLATDLNELQAENGELLRKMLHAIGYAAEGQPGSADSPPPHAARVLCLGPHALRRFTDHGMDLGVVRGMWTPSLAGRLLATHPPSYLHNNPAGKKASWADLQSLLADLQLPLPPWTRSSAS